MRGFAHRVRFIAAFAVASHALIASAGDDSSVLRNWFGDPFFQVSAFVAGCPEPRGPRTTKDVMEREAHVRTERGTRCYLEGRCAKANSYQYDAEIAAELRRQLEASHVLARGTIWVTVQRRWVWLQGCVSSEAQKRALASIARKVPAVERVFVELGAKDRPAYVTLVGSGR